MEANTETKSLTEAAQALESARANEVDAAAHVANKKSELQLAQDEHRDAVVARRVALCDFQFAYKAMNPRKPRARIGRGPGRPRTVKPMTGTMPR